MNSFDNRKELETGFLKIEEQRNFSGKITDVTLLYYPNSNKTSLLDWKSRIDFEIQSYYDNQEIEHVRIWEFLSKPANQGYGTVILQEFFNYFTERQTQPVEVDGELSAFDEADENNHQRRDHIYRKFGFEIVDGWVKTTIN